MWASLIAGSNDLLNVYRCANVHQNRAVVKYMLLIIMAAEEYKRQKRAKVTVSALACLKCVCCRCCAIL